MWESGLDSFPVQSWLLTPESFQMGEKALPELSSSELTVSLPRDVHVTHFPSQSLELQGLGSGTCRSEQAVGAIGAPSLLSLSLRAPEPKVGNAAASHKDPQDNLEVLMC